MGKMDVLDMLERDFNNYNSKNEYEKLNNIFNPLVKDSVIGKGFLFNLRDYEEETFGFKQGKTLNKLPKNTKNIKIYSFNECLNNIIMVDTYGNAPNIIDREFCFYEHNTLKTIYYSGGFIRLRNVSLTIETTNDKTETVFNYGPYGISIRKYIYQNNILEKIIVETKEHNKNEYTNYELLFEFTGNNLVKITQAYPNGYKKEIYK
jgi:hypothetical protein